MHPAPLRNLGRAAMLLFAIAGFGGTADAQQPTQAQASAIRSACPSDFQANCSGVQPGGAAALACLQQNMANLSPACQSAVGAVAGSAAAPQAAPGTTAAPPAAATTPAPAASPAQATTALPAGKPAAKPAKPTQAQQNAIRSACQSDFRANCAGVQPGGQAALACLQQNMASLSPSCQSAVGAIGGGAATAPAGAPPAAARVAAPPPVALTPRQEIRIVRESCGPDFRRLCGTVPLGGGRAIACLRANAASLSPACQGALMAR